MALFGTSDMKRSVSCLQLKKYIEGTQYKKNTLNNQLQIWGTIQYTFQAQNTSH